MKGEIIVDLINREGLCFDSGVFDNAEKASRAHRFKGVKPPMPTAQGICPAPALAILRATALLNRVQPLSRRPPPPADPPAAQW